MFLAPTVAEPFQTLAMVYEDRNDLDKFFEVWCFVHARVLLVILSCVDFADCGSLETN